MSIPTAPELDITAVPIVEFARFGTGVIATNMRGDVQVSIEYDDDVPSPHDSGDWFLSSYVWADGYSEGDSGADYDAVRRAFDAFMPDHRYHRGAYLATRYLRIFHDIEAHLVRVGSEGREALAFIAHDKWTEAGMDTTTMTRAHVIEQEVRTYNAWANGESMRYILAVSEPRATVRVVRSLSGDTWAPIVPISDEDVEIEWDDQDMVGAFYSEDDAREAALMALRYYIATHPAAL